MGNSMQVQLLLSAPKISEGYKTFAYFCVVLFPTGVEGGANCREAIILPQRVRLRLSILGKTNSAVHCLAGRAAKGATPVVFLQTLWYY